MSEISPLWYVFRDACYNEQYGVAEKLLAEMPSLLYLTTGGMGETVLHFLAIENSLAAVSWLQAKGADINTKNAFGTPAVFEVAQLEYKELFVWFKEHGADLQAVDGNGQGIMEYLLEFEKDEMADWVRGQIP